MDRFYISDLSIARVKEPISTMSFTLSGNNIKYFFNSNTYSIFLIIQTSI